MGLPSACNLRARSARVSHAHVSLPSMLSVLRSGAGQLVLHAARARCKVQARFRGFGQGCALRSRGAGVVLFCEATCKSAVLELDFVAGAVLCAIRCSCETIIVACCESKSTCPDEAQPLRTSPLSDRKDGLFPCERGGFCKSSQMAAVNWSASNMF